MSIFELLKQAIELQASDLHITVGSPPILRINGSLQKVGEVNLTPDDTIKLVKELTDEHQFKRLEDEGEIDMSYSYPGMGRFRVNIYKQRGSYGIAIRSVALDIPTLDKLGLPSILGDLARKQSLLVILTVPTLSVK